MEQQREKGQAAMDRVAERDREHAGRDADEREVREERSDHRRLRMKEKRPSAWTARRAWSPPCRDNASAVSASPSSPTAGRNTGTHGCPDRSSPGRAHTDT